MNLVIEMKCFSSKIFCLCLCSVKADFLSVEFSERAEILLFTRENVALKLNRLLRLSNFLLSKIPSARKIPLTGDWPLPIKSIFLHKKSRI